LFKRFGAGRVLDVIYELLVQQNLHMSYIIICVYINVVAKLLIAILPKNAFGWWGERSTQKQVLC
jgi:hypothetical protein